MADILFFEKPGCLNNTKQKQWLEAAGHIVNANSILSHPWTREELCLYFDRKPVEEWFNRSAPKVKTGKITPETINAETALDMMVADPILIKRPLIRVGNEYVQGFDKDYIHQWIGLAASPGNEADVAALRQEDLTRCPMLAKAANCDDPKP